MQEDKQINDEMKIKERDIKAEFLVNELVRKCPIALIQSLLSYSDFNFYEN